MMVSKPAVYATDNLYLSHCYCCYNIFKQGPVVRRLDNARYPPDKSLSSG